MSPQERAWRSQLAKIVSSGGLLRGCLLERDRSCGKPYCRCARGQKHHSLYLVLGEGGRYRQLFVPKEYEPQVRQWMANAHAVRDLLKDVSEIYWQKIQRREL